MAWDMLRLILLATKHLFSLLPTLLISTLHSRIHALTYRPPITSSAAHTILVVGGSFAGIQIARDLANSIPSGWEVVLVEKNSHFNYLFNFPRYSVLRNGCEKKAFIPYAGIVASVPKGSLRIVQGIVESITKDSAALESGQEIQFAFLVLATGSAQSPPAKMEASDRTQACAELGAYQSALSAADRLAVVGGGAVGVELAADVKSYYPKKHVSLVHSREQLLPRFGRRLHTHVLQALEKLGVEVVRGERPHVTSGEKSDKQSLEFGDGRVVEYDLVIRCTGQKPNTSLFDTSFPSAISPLTGRVLVQPTLQIQAPSTTHVFALGDVAETQAPQMARAALMQSLVVQRNICSLIRGVEAKARYVPRPEIEGALKLTLGKTEVVLYCQTEGGEEILVSTNGGKDDLEAERAWKMFGADMRGLDGQDD